MADPNAERQPSGAVKDEGQAATEDQARDTEGEIPNTPGAGTMRLRRPTGELSHTLNERGETPSGIVGTTTGGAVRVNSSDSIGSGTIGVPTGSGATGTNSSSETPVLTGNTTTAGGDVA